MADARRQLQCVIVSPERALFDEPADFVAVPMYDGEVGFLPGRAPLIGRLGYGELRVRRGDKTRRFFVDGGFVQVRGGTVTVLTSKALPAEEIKPDAVTGALEKARAALGQAAGAEAQVAQQGSVDRLRSQLRIGQRVAEARA